MSRIRTLITIEPPFTIAIPIPGRPTSTSSLPTTTSLVLPTSSTPEVPITTSDPIPIISSTLVPISSVPVTVSEDREETALISTSTVVRQSSTINPYTSRDLITSGPNTQIPTSDSKGLEVWQIVGIVAGVLVFAILALAIAVYFTRRAGRKRILENDWRMLQAQKRSDFDSRELPPNLSLPSFSSPSLYPSERTRQSVHVAPYGHPVPIPQLPVQERGYVVMPIEGQEQVFAVPETLPRAFGEEANMNLSNGKSGFRSSMSQVLSNGNPKPKVLEFESLNKKQ